MFLSFQCHRKGIKKDRSRQRTSCRSNSTFSPKQLVVSSIHGHVQTESAVTSTRRHSQTVPTVGQINSSPPRETYVSDFRRFTFQFLQHHGLQPRTARHIVNNGWRQSTGTGYATCTRRWLRFCAETKKDKYDMNVNNCLEFFSFLTDNLQIPLSQLRICRSFLSISRKLARIPYSENDIALLKKYLNGVINEKPQLVKKPRTSWDVECLLKYFQSISDNDSLPIPSLAGKLALLILLSTMCRSGEVVHLRISQIEISNNGKKVVFHIPGPTKTMNFDTFQHHGLQHLTISKLSEEPKICPVQCLQAYINRTKTLRCGEDRLFIIAESGRGAARQTILRWVRRHFRKAGILNYAVHSTRAASSTTALLMGMSVDEIVAKVGWLNNTTFVRVYMRPRQKLTNSYSNFTDQKVTTAPPPRLLHEATNMMSKFKLNKTEAKSLLQASHDNNRVTSPHLNDTLIKDNSNTQTFQQQWKSDMRVRIATDKIKTKTNKFLKFHRFTPGPRTTTVPPHPTPTVREGDHSTKVENDSAASLLVKSKLKEVVLQCQVPLPGDLCNLTTDDLMNTSFIKDNFSDKDLQDIASGYPSTEDNNTFQPAETTGNIKTNQNRLSKGQRQISDHPFSQNTPSATTGGHTPKLVTDTFSPCAPLLKGTHSSPVQTTRAPSLQYAQRSHLGFSRTRNTELASVGSTHMVPSCQMTTPVSKIISHQVTYREKGNGQHTPPTVFTNTPNQISYIHIPLDQVMQTKPESTSSGSTSSGIKIWDCTQNKFITVYPLLSQPNCRQNLQYSSK